MEYYGYAGQILRVDLSSGKIKREPLSQELIEGYLGGAGMQYRLIYDLLRPGLDPYSPDAPLIIGTGPLTGTLAPLSGKVFATAKVPAIASKSERKHFVWFSAGGNKRFGAMLKNAGYDHVVITGRADRPSYLKIIDDDIEICDAADLWGNKGIYETSQELASRHKGATGPAGVWAIGKAGENLVRHAHGVVDMSGLLGRHGMAAVLGSKNLKAVVTLGTGGIKVAHPTRFMEVADRIRHQVMSHPIFHKGGLKGDKTGARGIRRPCMACPEGCKSEYQVKDGRFPGDMLRVTNASMMPGFSRKLGIIDHSDTVRLLNMVTDYGLDYYTIRGMLLFLTRLYERGVIGKKDTGGLELKFGDFEAYVKLLEKIVSRADIGDVTAEGWYPLIQRVGVDAGADFEDGCPIVKGVSTLTDVRGWGFGPLYGLGPVVTGMVRHRMGTVYWSPPGKDSPDGLRSLDDLRQEIVRLGATENELRLMFNENGVAAGMIEKVTDEACMVCDLLGVCYDPHALGDPMRDLTWLSELYYTATGIELTPADLRKRGEKAFNLVRVLNVREGFNREDDNVPSIWLQNTERPLILDESLRKFAKFASAEGESYLHDHFGRRFSRDDVHRMLDDYYEKRGWDIDRGVPTKAKLIELGLGEFVDIVEEALID
ncbi:MAG: aldehyde ferredoxin oxidoreductase N-terminal domain-containing protein [Dehalococcoidales bacterium]|jgi:aldehyde:ferredoxin oxidoreductase